MFELKLTLFSLQTKHVLNYEFPMFLADYIHRCGRTGRVGSENGGHVTSFVSRVIEFETVQEIEVRGTVNICT